MTATFEESPSAAEAALWVTLGDGGENGTAFAGKGWLREARR